jgi:EpsI family protein
LYVGYYRRQEEGKELTGEASGGLRLAGSTVLLPESNIRIGEVIHSKAGTTRGILFWYQVNGEIMPQVYLAKAYCVWNGLTRGRTDGAVVMIGWQELEGAPADQARHQALDFAARLLIPALRDYLPS